MNLKGRLKRLEQRWKQSPKMPTKKTTLPDITAEEYEAMSFADKARRICEATGVDISPFDFDTDAFRALPAVEQIHQAREVYNRLNQIDFR